jgi:catechol 2,3-dioxygenase
VELTVRDLGRSLGFYERVLGLETLEREDGRAALGAGEHPLLRLVEDPEAPERPARTSGLFHFALLVPTRARLAAALRRLAEGNWPLTGASDHLVSEALYLNDTDGIGIEIYRDRPRGEWSWDGDQVAMATLPLDLHSIASEPADGESPGRAGAGARIGHVHLNVADLGDAEGFYCEELGFEATARNYPGALFVAAGGYHHHVGLNIWNGQGAPPSPEGAVGLRHFEVVLPGATELEAAATALHDAGAEAEETAAGVLARDPAGNRVLLRT